MKRIHTKYAKVYWALFYFHDIVLHNSHSSEAGTVNRKLGTL